VKNTTLKEPIYMSELRSAINKGKPHKAPEQDGIGLEIYKGAWEITKRELLKIRNMYKDDTVLETQIKGVIVCTPKTNPIRIDEYRPLTLLNADYKIMTRITAERMKPHLTEIIHQNQYCGVQGKTIFEGVAAIRGEIAHAEITGKRLCVVSIDLSEVFDKISHEYL
jgi:hypothetical protein